MCELNFQRHSYVLPWERRRPRLPSRDNEISPEAGRRGRLRSQESFDRRVIGRHQKHRIDLFHQLAVLLALSASLLPFGIGAESLKGFFARLAARERQQVNQRVLRAFLLVGRPPETYDLHTMFLEELYRVVAKPGVKLFEFARHSVIGADFKASRVFRERRAGRDGRRRWRVLRRGRVLRRRDDRNKRKNGYDGNQFEEFVHCRWPPLLVPRIIGSDTPDMVFEIAAGEPAPAVILILYVPHDLGARRLGLSIDQIGV